MFWWKHYMLQSVICSLVPTMCTIPIIHVRETLLRTKLDPSFAAVAICRKNVFLSYVSRNLQRPMCYLWQGYRGRNVHNSNCICAKQCWGPNRSSVLSLGPPAHPLEFGWMGHHPSQRQDEAPSCLSEASQSKCAARASLSATHVAKVMAKGDTYSQQACTWEQEYVCMWFPNCAHEDIATTMKRWSCNDLSLRGVGVNRYDTCTIRWMLGNTIFFKPQQIFRCNWISIHGVLRYDSCFWSL